MAKRYRRRCTLGNVRKSRGRYSARYTHSGTEHTPGRTFTTPELADEWLMGEQLLIDRDEWTPPAERRTAEDAAAERSALTLDTFAREWIERRQTGDGKPLASMTRTGYYKYLNGRLAPLAAMPLESITYEHVEAWWADNADAHNLRRSAYMFMKTVMDDAASRKRQPPLIAFNPCMIENAARKVAETPKTTRSALVTSLTHADIARLIDELDREPFRMLLHLVAYCGLRPGEAFALTPADVHREHTDDGEPRYVLDVTKAVSGDAKEIKEPKSGSARRVAVPPHLAPLLDAHIAAHAAPGDDGLIFPSSNPHKPYATVQQVNGTSAATKDRHGRPRTPSGFNAARVAIGRPTLRIYDLRHFARNAWRSAGMDTDTAELMLGHHLPGVKDIYSHLDLKLAWPAMRKLSTLTGWQPPTPALEPSPAVDPDAPMIDPRLLAAMTPAQLRETLAILPDEHIAALIPSLSPATVAALITPQPATPARRSNA